MMRTWKEGGFFGLPETGCGRADLRMQPFLSSFRKRLAFREERDLTGHDGQQVPAGACRVVVRITAGSPEGRLDPGELSAETVVEGER